MCITECKPDIKISSTALKTMQVQSCRSSRRDDAQLPLDSISVLVRCKPMMLLRRCKWASKLGLGQRQCHQQYEIRAIL